MLMPIDQKASQQLFRRKKSREIAKLPFLNLIIDGQNPLLLKLPKKYFYLIQKKSKDEVHTLFSENSSCEKSRTHFNI